MHRYNGTIRLLSNLLTLLLGTAALVGWIFRVGILTSASEKYIPMAPNTAVGFIMLGIALLLLSRNLAPSGLIRKIVQSAALIVLIFSMLTIASHVGFIQASIDSLIFSLPEIFVDQIPVGKMAFFTASLFICASVSMLLLTAHNHSDSVENIAFMLSIIVCSIGLMFSISYSIGTPMFYGTTTIPLALNTSIAFTALGSGMVFLILQREHFRDLSGQISTDKKVLTGFSLALASVLIMSLMSYQNTMRSVSAGTNLIRTYNALENLESLISVVKDAETATRGFAITRQEIFLEPYNSASNTIPQLLQTAHIIFQDNPRQFETLQRIESIINNHHAVLEDEIQQIRTGRINDAKQSILSGKGKFFMDSLRVLITLMESREQNRLLQQTSDRNFLVTNTIVTNVALILTILIMFGFMFVGIQHDLSGRKEAEEKLRQANDTLEDRVQERTVMLQQSEERHRTALDNMLEGCQIIDFSYRYAYVNAIAAAQGHSSKELLTGKTMMEMYPGIELTPFFSALQLCMNERTHHQMENEFAFPDGTNGWFNLSLEPVREGMFILSIDITERKKAEQEIYNLNEVLKQRVSERTEELRQSEERYRTLIYSIDEGFCIIEMIFDANGNPVDYRFLEINPSFVKQTGLIDAVGKTMREFAPDHEKHWFEIYGKIAISGEPARFENRAEQLHRWYDVYAFRFGVPEQRQVAIVFNDITERKRTAEEILNSKAQLEVLNKELEAFSYSVSHDLRAPLRHINGFIELLLKTAAPTLNEKALRYLGIIADSAKQMGQLIDDLLVFSRMVRTDMTFTSINLNDIVNDVISSFSADIKNRSIEWRIEQFPSITADAAMMKVVIVNLLSNAVKYTRTKEHAVITMSHSLHGEKHIFSVHDNGVGFDMQYKHKLFGVFQRLHSSTQFEGTGIGLANVQRVINRHGGDTWAEGIINEGATIFFSIPVNEKGS